MSEGSEPFIWLTLILPRSQTIFSVVAAQKRIKLPHHKIRLSVQSIFQVSHRLSIGAVVIVQ